MNEKISLIIPSKNEIETLGTVLTEVQNNRLIDEIIVIVDDENDNSIEVAKKHNCKIVIQKSKGYGSAIIEGFKNAKNKYKKLKNYQTFLMHSVFLPAPRSSLQNVKFQLNVDA